MAIYKKGNRWYTSLYVNGEKKRQVVHVKGKDPSEVTRQDALKVEAVRKAQIAQGIELASTKAEIPFTKLLNEYLEWCDDNHKDSARDHQASNNIRPFFSKYKASNVNTWIVDKYKAKRKNESASPETINKELNILSGMYKKGVEWKRIKDNPIKNMKREKVKQRDYKVINHQEYLTLIDYSPDYFKPVIECIYTTGMRPIEIQNLKWSEVSFSNKQIKVLDSKNGDDRTIDLTENFLKTLKSIKENSNSDNVFTNKNGKPYTSKTRWKTVWSNIRKKSGINIRFYDLRHTFLTNLSVELKEDPATVMSIGGHKDIRMFLRYNHTNKDAKRKAIEKLQNHLISSNVGTYPDTSTNSSDNKGNNIVSLSS